LDVTDFILRYVLKKHSIQKNSSRHKHEINIIFLLYKKMKKKSYFISTFFIYVIIYSKQMQAAFVVYIKRELFSLKETFY